MKSACESFARLAMAVTIKIPDNAAKHFGDSPESIALALLEKAALEDYRSERISIGKLSEILGQDRSQTEEFLDRHNARLPYTLEMLEEDRRSIRKILAAS
jgi:predicted HTH domain antitoxin